MQSNRFSTTLLFCAVTSLAAPPAGAAVIAMVTDLQGKATAVHDGRPRDLTILSELEAGTLVQLDRDAALVVLYLDAGDEFAFRGPATIDVRPGQPAARGGAAPERRRLQTGRAVRIQAVGVAQGATVLRGMLVPGRVQFLSLNKSCTLESSPEFRWQPIAGALKYELSLSDAGGRLLYEKDVTTTSLRLPADIVLSDGATYAWDVTARLPNGRTARDSSKFTVATAELRAEALAARPPASASLSSRIAYAAWLEQNELKDEARKYWAAAAAERPDDRVLRRLGAAGLDAAKP